jgi:catechol 2,3-dioxygenase-like lactoylglutathione lyase family enzyme
MLDHVSLSVSDLPPAAAFYDAAFAPLGYARVWSFDTAVGYGPEGGGDKLALKAKGEERAPDRVGAHVAFSAPSLAAVDAFHAAALAAGGRDNGAPGPRPQYGSGYYAAFVIDPDGHRIEAVFHGPPDP